MNLYRLDLVSLSLFNLVARTGSISKGAELAHLAVGASPKTAAPSRFPSRLTASIAAERARRHRDAAAQ